MGGGGGGEGGREGREGTKEREGREGTGKWDVSCSLYSLKYYYRSKKEKIY